MPHRRKPEKGSFGSHLDELVKHFAHGHPSIRTESSKPAKTKRKRKISVHQALFERAAH